MAILRGSLADEKPAGESVPSLIYIETTAGDGYYLWVDTSGNLRIEDDATVETAGFNYASGGHVVGGQS